MLHPGQREWGRFPSSRITIVSFMWWCLGITLTPAPSCPIILDSPTYFFLDFLRFTTTTGQPFPMDVRICPSYLNVVVFSRGRL